jgi:hypothetical protein
MRNLSLKEKKPLFEKSGAKTSLNLGHGRWISQRPWRRFPKSFCFFFFRKRSAYLLLIQPKTTMPQRG